MKVEVRGVRFVSLVHSVIEPTLNILGTSYIPKLEHYFVTSVRSIQREPQCMPIMGMKNHGGFVCNADKNYIIKPNFVQT
jgi:hypothetical protein